MEEVRNDNLELKKSVDLFEKERYSLCSRNKKLEREIYKMSCEKNKLNSVIQLQKESMNELQKDYYESRELDYNEATKRTFEKIPPLLDITNNNDGSVIYNKYKKPYLRNDSKKENLLHSFDNILTPLETRTHYDQISPFSSAKTLNKLGKTFQTKSDCDHKSDKNDTAVCNSLMQDISESQQTIKINVEHTCKSSSKNLSNSSSKFRHIGESSQSIGKSSSKYNLSKYRTEPHSHALNSPIDEDVEFSNQKCKGRRGKLRVIKHREEKYSRIDRSAKEDKGKVDVDKEMRYCC